MTLPSPHWPPQRRKALKTPHPILSVWVQLSVALLRTLACCGSGATPSDDIQQVLPLFA